MAVCKTIKHIDQDERSARVTLSGEDKSREFDLVILSEGLFSRTRAMVFNEPVDKPIRRLHYYVCGFSIPYNPALGTREELQWGRTLNFLGRRAIYIRPLQDDMIAVGFLHYDKEKAAPRAFCSSSVPVEDKKRFWKELMRDAGWKVNLLIDQMDSAPDFYMQEIGQTQPSAWSRGRVAMVGDTASCPSPLTGMGTTVAISQAYVLAARIASHGADYRSAFAEYESSMRPWVENVQKLIPGFASGITAPATSLGIRLFLLVAYIASVLIRSGVIGAATFWFPNREPFPLPSVEVFDSVGNHFA